MAHLFKTSQAVQARTAKMVMTLLMVVLVAVLKRHQLSLQARLQTQTRLKQLSNSR